MKTGGFILEIKIIRMFCSIQTLVFPVVCFIDSLISQINFRLTPKIYHVTLNAEMLHHALAAGTQLNNFLFLHFSLQVEAGKITNSFTKMNVTVFKKTSSHIHGIVKWMVDLKKKKQVKEQEIRGQEAGILFLARNTLVLSFSTFLEDTEV